MSPRTPLQASRLESHRRLAAENLKRCPVCDAVNATGNVECFVCRWHGAFDHDPSRVGEALDELIVRCPELVDAMLNAPVRRESVWTVAKHWLLGRFRRTLDVKV